MLLCDRLLEPNMYMPAELARMLGVCERRLCRWCTRDGLPHDRRGVRRMFVDLGDLAIWLRSHSWVWSDLPETNKAKIRRLIAFYAGAPKG